MSLKTMSSEWGGLVYDRQQNKKYFPSIESIEHPLRPSGNIYDIRDVRKLSSKTSSRTSSTISLDVALDGSDPLSQFARLDSVDTLPKSTIDIGRRIKDRDGSDVVDDASNALTAAWISRRSAILAKFTTGEKLTIVSSFLHDGELIKTQITVSEKMKNRLEQLDDFNGQNVHKMIDLTQQEYQMRIDQLNNELIQAWNTDQRVNALKIAIQCSKLLTDTSVLQFYPSQFVLITDILDNFGKLVYERLRTKAEYFEPGSNTSKSLPINFTLEMVPECIRDTCLNWFYKIASIRELLPRLYLEMAIIKSYKFLSQNEFDRILSRIGRMIRGIGDPLIAIYARCYLCRVGAMVSNNSEYIKEILNDFLFVYPAILSGGIRTELAYRRIDINDYLSFFTPALDWIMYSLVMKATGSELDEVVAKCNEKKNNGLLFQSILTSFRSSYIASRGMKFVHILSTSSEEDVTRAQLFRLFGQSLCKCQPSDDQLMPVLCGSLKVINSLTKPSEFVHCIEPWTEYTSIHFNTKEINSILGQIIVCMNQNRNFEKHYNELQSICNNVIENVDDIEELLVSENFMLFIDLFQKESVRIDVCKAIMTIYKTKSIPLTDNDIESTDAVIINALMFICKSLNDGITALTGEDERRQTTQLISHFVRNIHFGRDFERQLSFYVESRAAFVNLDGVFVTLVQCVNLLAIKTRRIVNGRHTRKTSAFVKSCAAYCFITIPSITSVISRMNLYLMSGQVALLNLCFGQADAFFEAAINSIRELPKTCEIDGKPKSTENFLISFIANSLSTLIIVPDSPEQGVLYLIRLLIDTIKSLSFENDNHCLARIYLLVLDTLIVTGQEKYPYHVLNVISNDELYGSDVKFLNEIHSICSQIVELILIQFKQLGDNNNLRSQSILSLDLFEKIVFYGNLKNEKIFLLCTNLWNLSMKNRKFIDPKLPGKMLMKIQNYLIKITDHQYRQLFEQLTMKMKLKM